MHYADFSLLATILTIAVVVGAILGTCAYLILLERKISAYVQDRIGPNRVGPLGLLQPIADGLKFLLKEDIIPNHVDKMLYLVAPAIAMSTALFAFTVVPFGPTDPPPNPPWPQTQAEAEQVQAAFEPEVDRYNASYQFVIAPHVDVGIVFIFAIGSLAVYAVILGGWASNEKYSLLGGLRSSAQLVSYEIPLGMSVLGVVLLAGSANLERIMHAQATGGPWYVFFQPLGFLLFLISVFAECNRLPFDLPEAEQELVGGYHTEYSAMKFALFFLGEYTHMITTSFLLSVLFFGGWHFPWIAEPSSNVVIKVIVLAAKMAFFIVFYMMIRWTIPRFRFDQLMGLAWKVLIPLAMVNLVCVMVVRQLNWTPWVLLPVTVLVVVAAGLLSLSWPTTPRRAVAVAGGRTRVEAVVRQG
jgi:NADH-quinone oxidoreductase subunit H